MASDTPKYLYKNQPKVGVLSLNIVKDTATHWGATYPGRPGAMLFIAKNDTSIVGTGDVPYAQKSENDLPAAPPPEAITLKPGWTPPPGFENVPVKYDRQVLEFQNTPAPTTHSPVGPNEIPDVSHLINPK